MTWQSSHPFHLTINASSCESEKEAAFVSPTLLFVSISAAFTLHCVLLPLPSPCLHLAITASFPLVHSEQAVLDLAQLLH